MKQFDRTLEHIFAIKIFMILFLRTNLTYSSFQLSALYCLKFLTWSGIKVNLSLNCYNFVIFICRASRFRLFAPLGVLCLLVFCLFVGYGQGFPISRKAGVTGQMTMNPNRGVALSLLLKSSFAPEKEGF